MRAAAHRSLANNPDEFRHSFFLQHKPRKPILQYVLNVSN